MIMAYEQKYGPNVRLSQAAYEALNLKKREEDLQRISLKETYRDTNGDWCCSFTVQTLDGETLELLFVWDVPSQNAACIGGRKPFRNKFHGLFVTALNAAKDHLRKLAQEEGEG